ncbi:MAG: hypothetical protein CL398_12930 [Acidiferrobacteraceae bacterium]|nr:hypothetical protein [Acidiferrobacteraceae bacterium]
MSSYTGYQIDISGSIDVNLFPTPHFKVSEIAVGIPTASDITLSANIKKINGSLDINSVLLGRVVFNDLSIEQPSIYLDSDRDYRQSWNALVSQSIGSLSSSSLVLARQLNIQDAQVIISNKHSEDSRTFVVTSAQLEILANPALLRFELVTDYGKGPISLVGSLHHLIDGQLQPISIRYRIGSIDGTVVGHIQDIFQQGIVDLDVTTQGDDLRYLYELLDLQPIVSLPGSSFTARSKVQGSLNKLSLSAINGTIVGQDFGIQFRGRVSDMFGQSNIDINLTSQFSSINWVSEIIGESILAEGVGVASARLLGQQFQDLHLRDVKLDASTSLGTITIEGFINQLGILSNSTDRSNEFGLNFSLSTTEIERLLERLDQNIPVDGAGTVTGLVVANDEKYSIEDLSISIESPELNVSASGRVDLGEIPGLSLDFDISIQNIAAPLRAHHWTFANSGGVPFKARGSLTAKGGIVVASDILLKIANQSSVGYFSGRLPLLGYQGNADWLLRIVANDIGEVIGGSSIYPLVFGAGEFLLHVAVVDNQTTDLKFEINSELMSMQSRGKISSIDSNFGFDLQYEATINGATIGKAWLARILSELNSYQVRGSVRRSVGIAMPVEVSMEVIQANYGTMNAVGILYPERQQGSDFEVSVQGNSISKLISLIFTLNTNPIVDKFFGTSIVRFRGSEIYLEDFSLSVGDNDIGGSVSYSLSGPDVARPRISGKVASTYLNLNELFPPIERQFLFSQEPLPFEWSKTHDMDITITLQRLLRRNYDLRKLSGTVTAYDGEVRASSSSSAFGGNLSLSLDLDTKTMPYEATYRYDWRGLDLALLPAAKKFDREINGQLDLHGQILGSGNSLHQIMADGNGYLSVELNRARFLRGGMELLTTSPVNIAEQILREVSPWAKRRKFFEIECGVIAIKLENGVGSASVPPDHTIAIKAKEFRLSGFGELNMSDESLSLSVRSKARRLGLSAATLIEQAGLSPLYPPFYRIVGTLLRPKVEPDPEGANLIETSVKLGAAWATGGTSVVLLSLIDRLAIEPVGCEGARERGNALTLSLTSQ